MRTARRHCLIYIHTNKHAYIRVCACICVSMHSRLLLLITNVASSSSVFCLSPLSQHTHKTNESLFALFFLFHIYICYYYITTKSRLRFASSVTLYLSFDGQGNNNVLCTHWFCNLLCCCPVVYVCCAGFLLQFIIIYCLFCFWCNSHTHTATYTCMHADIQILWLQCCLWRAAHLCYVRFPTLLRHMTNVHKYENMHMYVYIYTCERACVCSIINVLVF